MLLLFLKLAISPLDRHIVVHGMRSRRFMCINWFEKGRAKRRIAYVVVVVAIYPWILVSTRLEDEMTNQSALSGIVKATSQAQSVGSFLLSGGEERDGV